MGRIPRIPPESLPNYYKKGISEYPPEHLKASLSIGKSVESGMKSPSVALHVRGGATSHTRASVYFDVIDVGFFRYHWIFGT